jgi:hypothetical protein
MASLFTYSLSRKVDFSHAFNLSSCYKFATQEGAAFAEKTVLIDREYLLHRNYIRLYYFETEQDSFL